jgi:hypothetical protein
MTMRSCRLPVVRSARREGRVEEIMVRLAGVHAAAELAEIASGRQRSGRPDGLPEDTPSEDEKEAGVELPESLRDLYDARTGFANYSFSRLERDRVSAAIQRLVEGTPADGGFQDSVWELSGTLEDGRPFRIELSSVLCTIDLPTGTSRLDPRGGFDQSPVPPGSGGLLAALVVWRQLLGEGPAAVGRTDYTGTAPVAVDAAAFTNDMPLADLLTSDVSGVRVETFVSGPTAAVPGRLLGLDLWSNPRADPCEVRFFYADSGGRDVTWLPAGLEVHVGGSLFGRFRIEHSAFSAVPEGGDTEPAVSGDDQGEGA